jgi:histone acetyltransferase MYST1
MTTNIDAANQTLHSNTTDPPNVDDRVHVKWTRGKDGQHHTAEDEIPLSLPAKIVERRALGKKRLHPSALANLNANELDYYVHFIGHDRRLDQWVKIDDLELETLERVDPQEQQILHSTADVAAAAAADNNSNQDEQELVTVGGGNWHGGGAHQLEKEHEEATKVKNIENIIMGSYEVEAWYYSPYPEEYSNLKTIYVCEFCLSYMRKSRTYVKHKEQCACRHPPGTEIYRHEDIAVYELDGKDHKAYCQKLCLLAKLFLDHKTLYFDVTPFYFYVITKVDCHGAHIVGYFSKEKVREHESSVHGRDHAGRRP